MENIHKIDREILQDLYVIINLMPNRYAINKSLIHETGTGIKLWEYRIPIQIISYAIQKGHYNDSIRFLERLNSHSGEDFDKFINRWTQEKIKEVFTE